MRNFSIFICFVLAIGLLLVSACVNQKNTPLPALLSGTNIVVATNIIPSDLVGTWKFNSIFAGVIDRNEIGFAATNSANNATTPALNTLTAAFNTFSYTFALNEEAANICTLSLGNLPPNQFFTWIGQPALDISQLVCQVQGESILVFSDNTLLLTIQMNTTKNQIFIGFIDRNNQTVFNLNYILKGVVWVVLQR